MAPSKSNSRPQPATHPYGLWPSAITADSVARAGRRFGLAQADGDWVYWSEGRPEEKGRQVLVRRRSDGGPMEELLPAPWSARSRIHEYGGGEFHVADGTVYFINDADQDVYVLVPGQTPERLTAQKAMRFADFALDASRNRLIAVAERTRRGADQPENLIVAITLAGARRGRVTDLATGRDFYAFPRLSPDGARLAFMAWDLPGMPWDQAAVYLADLDKAGKAGALKRIAGGRGVAASHPAFAPDGTLVFLSDATGWGNLNAWNGREAIALTKSRKDIGRPLWSLGGSPFAIDGDNRIWAAPIENKADGKIGSDIVTVDTRGRRRETYAIAETQLDTLTPTHDGIAAFSAAADAPTTLRSYRLAHAYGESTLRTASDLDLADVARPQMVSFRGGDGATTFAFYYPPTNDAVKAPRGKRPPALVLAHGGPTGMTGRGLNMRIQYYTSRGFAVLDVDYAGSTGYGRKYRERLDGEWGIADVADCAAGARFLARQGLADPDRIAITGGSAGGYTVLMALATTDAFAAGASHYGISDLTLLMEHTHKFESGYLHRLLGTTQRAWKSVCRERSPISLIGGIAAPVILFQGLEDKVVPPEQSRLIAHALGERDIAAELHEFEGEGHGFRRAETIVAVLEAELAFLIRALRLG
ncbi:MAG: prolyl oligopeptidase family serine peptidase [Hyphomicrobiaceae bacterium]